MKLCNKVCVAVLVVMLGCHILDYPLFYFATYCFHFFFEAVPLMFFIQLFCFPVLLAVMIWSLVKSPRRWRSLGVNAAMGLGVCLTYMLPWGGAIALGPMGLRDRIKRTHSEQNLRAFAEEIHRGKPWLTLSGAQQEQILDGLYAKYGFLNSREARPWVWVGVDDIMLVWGSSEIGFGVAIGFDGKTITNDYSHPYRPVYPVANDIYCEDTTD